MVPKTKKKLSKEVIKLDNVCIQSDNESEEEPQQIEIIDVSFKILTFRIIFIFDKRIFVKIFLAGDYRQSLFSLNLIILRR